MSGSEAKELLKRFGLIESWFSIEFDVSVKKDRKKVCLSVGYQNVCYFYFGLWTQGF